MSQLPLPPIALRRSVGPIEDKFYCNPTGAKLFDSYGVTIDDSRVFDFGCGCGRIARQLLEQKLPPQEYLGIDLHKAAIDWCVENLASGGTGFTFRHLDVHNAQFNANTNTVHGAFPAESAHYTLAIAHSVFTHIVESNVNFFMSECARVLVDDGAFVASWFVFDKRYFPAMQPFQNSLYINLNDPTNAVWYDRSFLRASYAAAGLKIVKVLPPALRGYQFIVLARKSDGESEADFPEDLAPFGSVVIPINGT